MVITEDRMNTATPSSPSAAHALRHPVALVTLFAGLALVFLTGFSHSTTLHNATHDTRHALAFPCH
jgi:cobalt transporter subunit CbtB